MLANDMEVGPGNLLTKLRKKAGVRYDQYGNLDCPGGSLCDLVMCPLCNSVWIGILFTMLYIIFLLFDAGIFILLFLPLALSGGAIIIKKLVDRMG